MPVDWKNAETMSRLFTATIASLEGSKIDIRRIAALYGEGATYDTVEHRFRIIKKDAAKLREEVDQGNGPAVIPKPVRPSELADGAKTTPAKKPRGSKKENGGDHVANGRVSKSTPRKRTAAVKKEEGDENDSGTPGRNSPPQKCVKKEKDDDTYADEETGT